MQTLKDTLHNRICSCPNTMYNQKLLEIRDLSVVYLFVLVFVRITKIRDISVLILLMQVINMVVMYLLYLFFCAGSSTFCVLAEKVALRVTNLIKRNVYDIVKIEWFERCMDAGHWVPW